MALLNEEQKKRVSAEVAAAEEHTAGELVVVLAKRADDYAVFRAGLAASLAVTIAIEALYVLPSVPDWILLFAQLPLGALLYWQLGSAAVLRLIVPKKVRATVVEQRAFRAFLEAGVMETRDRSGVLVFVSEAEHRAVILADRGIHERVEPDEWQRDVDDLIAAIKQGRAAEGLVAAIQRIGGILADTFPPRADDENELSDAVREV